MIDNAYVDTEWPTIAEYTAITMKDEKCLTVVYFNYLLNEAVWNLSAYKKNVDIKHTREKSFSFFHTDSPTHQTNKIYCAFLRQPFLKSIYMNTKGTDESFLLICFFMALMFPILEWNIVQVRNLDISSGHIAFNGDYIKINHNIRAYQRTNGLARIFVSK